MMRPDGAPSETVNYKKKYQALKKKLKLLVYEQESFTDELKKSQRKLLKVSRDRSFLLDRLLQYEHVDDSSSDSESTVSSDSGNELPPSKDGGANFPKKKRPAVPHLVTAGPSSASASGLSMDQNPGLPSLGRQPQSLKEPAKKKPKVAVRKAPFKLGGSVVPGSKLLPESITLGAAVSRGKPASSATLATILEQPLSFMGASTSVTTSSPQRSSLSREEIERHLDMKHSAKPQFLSIDMMAHNLPDDIFSHDNSNQDCGTDSDNIKVEVDDSDLVIDMA